jgi:hypothetical protein
MLTMRIITFILSLVIFATSANATEMVIHESNGDLSAFSIEDIETITFATYSGPPPQRILFIGNSLTQYNGGVDNHFRNLAAVAHPDGVHSNIHGTYLASCVFYACLFGESPEGIDYTPDPIMTPAERTALQKTAWETVLLYNPWLSGTQ